MGHEVISKSFQRFKIAGSTLVETSTDPPPSLFPRLLYHVADPSSRPFSLVVKSMDLFRFFSFVGEDIRKTGDMTLDASLKEPENCLARETSQALFDV